VRSSGNAHERIDSYAGNALAARIPGGPAQAGAVWALDGRVKIALVTRSLTRGGAQIQLVVLACRLAQLGHDVTTIVFYPGGPLQEVLDSAGVSVCCLEKAGRWDIIKLTRRYMRLLRERRFDALYSFLALENLLSLVVARASGTAIVWGLRGAAQDVGQFGYASRLLYALQRLLIRAPDSVISNSYAAVLELSLPPGSHFHVVPNGIDTDRFRRDSDSRREVRDELGIREDQKLIGCVARLDSVKDHPTLLRAAAIVLSRRRDARFVIVGAGRSDYAAALRQLATSLGIEAEVMWLGERSDVERVLSALDVYISASLAEGFSNSLAEAMACGVAPVVTRAGDSARIVGPHGTVVDVKSPDSLAAATLDWLDRDSPAVREARRSWIVNEFGVERMVEETIRVINEAAAGAER
jgi:glycosyltransferase involved in cell wall biosynthesis